MDRVRGARTERCCSCCCLVSSSFVFFGFAFCEREILTDHTGIDFELCCECQADNLQVGYRHNFSISLPSNQMESSTLRPSATLSPSANWYLSSCLTTSSNGMSAYAAKSSTVILDQQCRVVRHLRGHKKNSKITSVCFSQHTETSFLLATGGSDRRLCVWHAETGLLVEEHVIHTKEITSLISSFVTPGLFISGDKVGKVVVTSTSACLGLDAQDRSDALAVGSGGGGSGGGSGGSGGGSSSSGGGGSGSTSRSVTREMRPGSDSCVSCMASSPYDGSVVVVGYESGALVVVDIRTCVTLRRLAGHTRGVQSVSWMPPSYRTMANNARKDMSERRGRDDENGNGGERSGGSGRRERKGKKESGKSRKSGKNEEEEEEEEEEVRDLTEEERRQLHDGKLVYTATELYQFRSSATTATTTTTATSATTMPSVDMPSFVLEKSAHEETPLSGSSSFDLDAIFVTTSRDRSMRLWSSDTWEVRIFFLIFFSFFFLFFVFFCFVLFCTNLCYNTKLFCVCPISDVRSTCSSLIRWKKKEREAE